MTNPLNILGTVQKFNGVNIEQTRDFNHVHCQTYIEKIVSHHRGENVTLRSDQDLLLWKLTTNTKLTYNCNIQCIAELIYALTVCRIDISIAVITFSQHSNHPAEIHYEAIKQVFAYILIQLNAKDSPTGDQNLEWTYQKWNRPNQSANHTTSVNSDQ